MGYLFMTKEFKVKFRGVRGSYPVCSPEMQKYGGNTSCVEVRANGRTIILDAGTGIIELGGDLLKDYLSSGTDHKNRTQIDVTVLFSHAHMDHLQGLPFFKPAYIKGSKINLFGAKSNGKNFKELIADMVFKLLFPVEIEDMPAEISINNLSEHKAIIFEDGKAEPEIVEFTDESEIEASENAVIITCMKSYAHPKEGVKVFKVKCNGKSIVYATDKESYVGSDSRMISFSRGATLLIHDAQYTMEDYISPIYPKQGYGHSTMEMAIDIASLANVSRLVLFHLDPTYNDEFIEKLEVKAKGHFANAVFARENLEIDLMQTKCQTI
jgi:phosphoribosyl 1,2-cyclic phosphodiesterase